MITTINDWDDVNLAFKELLKIKRSVTDEQNQLNKQIDDLKDVANKKMQPVLAYEKELVQNIKAFCATRKKKKLDFTNKKSRELTFGTVGYRASGKITYVKKAEEIIKELEKNQMQQCINETKTIKITALSGYKDDVLEKLGMRRSSRENFYYELKAEEVKGNDG